VLLVVLQQYSLGGWKTIQCKASRSEEEESKEDFQVGKLSLATCLWWQLTFCDDVILCLSGVYFCVFRIMTSPTTQQMHGDKKAFLRLARDIQAWVGPCIVL
jgi:hypothetical protein